MTFLVVGFPWLPLKLRSHVYICRHHRTVGAKSNGSDCNVSCEGYRNRSIQVRTPNLDMASSNARFNGCKADSAACSKYGSSVSNRSTSAMPAQQPWAVGNHR